MMSSESQSASTAPLLEVRAIDLSYHAVRAVEQVSFAVRAGQIVCLIGANGAGKTTILRAISGLIRPRNGDILFRGQRISGIGPHRISRLGIAHAPEGRGVFANLTVEENLDLGAWRLSARSQVYREQLEGVYELFPRLKDRRKQNAGTLSGGEQQMLAIGRALMGKPDLLLLDEPSLGLAPQMIERIFRVIEAINREGKTILLVEQNALQALEIADYGLVLETGRVVAQGGATTLARSAKIREAYLGGIA